MKYKREIYEVMKDLGVLPNNLGYKYSCFIINEILEGNEDNVIALYNKAAKECGSTPSRVERAIRHTVELVCYNTDVEVLKKYFGNCLSPKSGKVYNHTFLVCIAEYIKVCVL